MTEPRRIPLTTLSGDVPPFNDESTSARNPSTSVSKEEETRSSSRDGDTSAARLVLTLFEPDDWRFPEFNYWQLVDKEISQTDNVQLSRHELKEKREKDEIAAVARKLEKKYGGKHKKTDRIQDLIDIGYGYDDDDSFIDNSEAYDEFVPSSITTKFGGFYVNSGVLQFRPASDIEADELSTEEKTFELTKKRKEHCEQDKPRKKPCSPSGERKSDMDPKLCTLSATGPDDNRIKKKKKAVKTLSVTSMLKKFQREKEKERHRMEKVAVSAPAPHLFPADAAGGGSLGLTDPLLSLIGSTTDHALIQAASTVDFDIDLDSLLDVSDDPLSPKSLPQTATETQLIQTKADDQTQLNVLSDAEAQVIITKSSSQPQLHTEQIQSASSSSSPQCAPLPEGLPPGLEDNIRKLLMAAKTSEGESKLKFFNPDINSILLDIELQCQGQGGQLRSKVYRHLSSFLPCSKDTLLKRVRKLLVTHVEEPPSVENPLQKLKEAIERCMPEQIASFNESCQLYEQVRTLKAAEEENMEEKGGRKGGPKKMFKWNQEIRECLGHVLRGKMDKSKEAQEMEEYIKTLLDSDIKPLWPKGWVQSRVLMRESKKLLGLTSLPGNKAKCIKGTSSIGVTSKPSDACKSLQETPVLTDVPQRADLVLTEATDMSSRVPLSFDQKEDAALKKGEVKLELGAHFSSLSNGNKSSVNTTSAPTLSVLADEALAREQRLTLSQKYFAAAVAKHWSICVDSSSPPLPPPPPQSRPVDFPVSSMCQIVLPGLLQARDVRHEGPGQVPMCSDDSDVTVC